jgi:hypothetical protein
MSYRTQLLTTFGVTELLTIRMPLRLKTLQIVSLGECRPSVVAGRRSLAEECPVIHELQDALRVSL